MKCLILAGGFGRRIYPIIGNTPKALLDYQGRPLISHLVDRIPQDIDILVSTNKKFEGLFSAWCRAINRPIELLVENARYEDQKLGSLTAISYWVQKKNINEDILVIAGDNYLEFDIRQFLAAYDGKNTLLAVYDILDKVKARSFGVIKMHGSRIVKFTEKPANPDSTLVATACYIFPPRILNTCKSYCQLEKRDLLGSFISYLVDTDKVYGFLFTEEWFDIGNEIKLLEKKNNPIPN